MILLGGETMEELYSAEGIPVSSTGRSENYLLKLEGRYDLEHLLQGHNK